MNKILNNIEHGWCDFELERFKGKPSYIRFLPMDVLNAYEEYKKSGHYIIEFDEELTQFAVIGYDNYSYIIHNQGDCRMGIFLQISAKDLISELVKEITQDVDLWAEWYSPSGSKESIKEIRRILSVKIKELGI